MVPGMLGGDEAYAKKPVGNRPFSMDSGKPGSNIFISTLSRDSGKVFCSDAVNCERSEAMARVSLLGGVVKATSLFANMKDKHRGSAFRRFGILPPIDKYCGIVEEA